MKSILFALTESPSHLSILTDREIDELYSLSRITEEDCRLFFDLSSTERAAGDAVHSTSSAVQLALQYGYFKAKLRCLLESWNKKR